MKMQAIDNKFECIKFIPYTLFDLWDTKRYTSQGFSSAFEIVNLGICIKEESKKYKLFLEEEKEFGILGVSNKVGIFDAYVQKGKDINQPYKKMDIGWLAYNPYRINVGSIGIKKAEHKNDYISPAYVVFSCNEKLLPEFLFLLFKTDTFNRIINQSTTGSVRQNLTIDILKTLKIPLPEINQQLSLVQDYFSKIHASSVLEEEANSLEREIDNYLYEALEINPSINKNEAVNLSFVNFEEVERWSVDFLINNKYSVSMTKGRYPSIKLKNFMKGYQYGLSDKASKENIGIPMLRMNNIFNSELLINDLKYIPDDPSLGNYILDKGDLLFNRTNSKELVGKTAVFDLDGKYTFASYLIRVRINPEIANVFYVNYLFNSSILKFQKDLVSRQITGQANINAQEMQDFLFPLPPLCEQNRIVGVINNRVDQIKKLREKAEYLTYSASEDFEKSVFSL